jgi:hypothetical protein
MRIRSTLTAIALISIGASLTACAESPPPRRHHAVVEIQVAPPAPRVVVVPAERRGYAWAPGYWRWNGHEHVWVEGRWIRERRGEHWVPAHWEESRHGYWHFEEGHWER